MHSQTYSRCLSGSMELDLDCIRSADKAVFLEKSKGVRAPPFEWSIDYRREMKRNKVKIHSRKKSLLPNIKQSKQPCYITFSLLQVHAHFISLLLAELAYKCNVNICDASALNSLVTLETAELLAHVVQIVLEVVVDAFFQSIIKEALFLPIPVSEVVTPTRGCEIEFAQVIGRAAAAVICPNETGGALCTLGGDEGRYAVLENELLICSDRAGVGRGRLWRCRRLSTTLDTALNIFIPGAETGVKFSTRAAVILDTSAIT